MSGKMQKCDVPNEKSLSMLKTFRTTFKLWSHLAIECNQYVLTKEEEEEEFKEANAFKFMKRLTSCDLDMIYESAGFCVI